MSDRVLVTGASGFIGSHLVERLVRDGFEVRAFVHYNAAGNWYNLEKMPREILSSVEIVAGDINDAYSVDHAVKGRETVFHLASLIGIPYSYMAPQSYVATNVGGTLHVLQACLRHKVRRLIHTSTSEVYGTAQYVPIDELHPLVGQSPYSASKIAADKLAESFWLSFGLPVAIVRPFNTFGPRQSARAVIPTILSQALTAGNLRLGSVDTLRDMTFVADTVNGFVCAAQEDQVLGEVVNLGTGQGFSIREIISQVESILETPLPFTSEPERIRPEKSEVMRLISNNSKAKRLMGWYPQVDLRSGLERTVSYMREHLADYKTDSYCT